MGKKWTEDDIIYLELACQDRSVSISDMADTLDRSEAAVKDKIKEYHLKDGTYNGRWTDAEIQYLINNYMFLKIKDMAEYLGRTYSGVSTKARALGLRQINKKRLNREKVSELAAKGYTYKEIAQKLGSTHQNVITYCCKRGIKVRKMSMSERDLSEWRRLNSLDNSKVLFSK